MRPRSPRSCSTTLDGSDARTIVAGNLVSWGDSLLADMKEGGGLCGAPLPDGTHALLNLDGPGYANLRALDLGTGSFADLTQPKGEAWSCSVSHDGKTVAYLYSDFMHPGRCLRCEHFGRATASTHARQRRLLSLGDAVDAAGVLRERSGRLHGAGVVHAGDRRSAGRQASHDSQHPRRTGNAVRQYVLHGVPVSRGARLQRRVFRSGGQYRPWLRVRRSAGKQLRRRDVPGRSSRDGCGRTASRRRRSRASP